jgi:hypothetical protein
MKSPVYAVLRRAHFLSTHVIRRRASLRVAGTRVSFFALVGAAPARTIRRLRRMAPTLTADGVEGNRAVHQCSGLEVSSCSEARSGHATSEEREQRRLTRDKDLSGCVHLGPPCQPGATGCAHNFPQRTLRPRVRARGTDRSIAATSTGSCIWCIAFKGERACATWGEHTALKNVPPSTESVTGAQWGAARIRLRVDPIWDSRPVTDIAPLEGLRAEAGEREAA